MIIYYHFDIKAVEDLKTNRRTGTLLEKTFLKKTLLFIGRQKDGKLWQIVEPFV